MGAACKALGSVNVTLFLISLQNCHYYCVTSCLAPASMYRHAITALAALCMGRTAKKAQQWQRTCSMLKLVRKAMHT